MSHPDLNRLREVIRNGGTPSNDRPVNVRSSRRTFKPKIIVFFLIMFMIIGTFSMKDVILSSIGNSIYSFVEEKLASFLEDEKRPVDPLPVLYVNVTSKGANIRSEPNLDTKIVTVVNHNTRLQYQNKTEKNGNIIWIKVKTAKGHDGWISDRIVKWNSESDQLLQALANDGNITAIKEIAKRFEYGIAIEENKKNAFSWYKVAADKGDVESQLNTGWFYEKGIGVKQDFEKAFAYYSHSAEQGNVDAMNNMGTLYMAGLGVEANGELAKQWFEKAINEGDSLDAITNLSVLYLQGTVIERDLNKGIKLMKEAEQRGDPDAIKIMNLYRNVSEKEFVSLIDQQK